MQNRQKCKRGCQNKNTENETKNFGITDNIGNKSDKYFRFGQKHQKIAGEGNAEMEEMFLQLLQFSCMITARYIQRSIG